MHCKTYIRDSRSPTREYITKVVVADQQIYDSGPFNFGAEYEDGTLSVVIDSLLAIRDSIPEEYRDSARCGIDSESGYEDSHYAHIYVSYVRPATPEEIAALEAEERRGQELHRARELAALAALKAKYEGAHTLRTD